MCFFPNYLRGALYKTALLESWPAEGVQINQP